MASFGAPGEGSGVDRVRIHKTATGTVHTQVGDSHFYSKYGIGSVSDSVAPPPDTGPVSTTGGPVTSGGLAPGTPALSGRSSSESAASGAAAAAGVRMKSLRRLNEAGTKFPKLEDCAHFHYEIVEIKFIKARVIVESDHYYRGHSSSSSSQDGVDEQPCFYIQVQAQEGKPGWVVRRTLKNLVTFDQHLHLCIFDRKYSLLPEIRPSDFDKENLHATRESVARYMTRFSAIAGDTMINCGPVLSWLEMDNRGYRVLVPDDSSGINLPAVSAAHVIKRYTAQAQDEISLEVGDRISIIDMPSPEDSVWWRGKKEAKKELQVGFFPCDCVETFKDKIPSAIQDMCPLTPTKPVLRKQGKFITLLRSLFSTRPSRNQLKKSGIVKERVFGCDLGEHLQNSGHDVPLVLEMCTEVIEEHGIVDGIYRLSGVASNIQKLRNDFDEEKTPDLRAEVYLQDIHSICSLLKAYFRELPNPLLTYTLYDAFAAALQTEEERLVRIHDIIQRLPPPHYRTAKNLFLHLYRVSRHGSTTGMHIKNLAIVWAPNLMRSMELDRNPELACSTAMLQGVGVQAIVMEFLIQNAEYVFSDRFLNSVSDDNHGVRRARPKSLAMSTPTKLISLEQAREQLYSASAAAGSDSTLKQKYIEVGEGPGAVPAVHTVLEHPSSKKKGRKGRKSLNASATAAGTSGSSWRSLFSRGASNKGSNLKKQDSSSQELLNFTAGTERKSALRAVHSVESLTSVGSRHSDLLDDNVFRPHSTLIAADELGVRPPSYNMARSSLGSSLDRASQENDSKKVKKSSRRSSSVAELSGHSESDLSELDDGTPITMETAPQSKGSKKNKTSKDAKRAKTRSHVRSSSDGPQTGFRLPPLPPQRTLPRSSAAAEHGRPPLPPSVTQHSNMVAVQQPHRQPQVTSQRPEAASRRPEGAENMMQAQRQQDVMSSNMAAAGGNEGGAGAGGACGQAPSRSPSLKERLTHALTPTSPRKKIKKTKGPAPPPPGPPAASTEPPAEKSSKKAASKKGKAKASTANIGPANDDVIVPAVTPSLNSQPQVKSTDALNQSAPAPNLSPIEEANSAEASVSDPAERTATLQGGRSHDTLNSQDSSMTSSVTYDPAAMSMSLESLLNTVSSAQAYQPMTASTGSFSTFGKGGVASAHSHTSTSAAPSPAHTAYSHSSSSAIPSPIHTAAATASASATPSHSAAHTTHSVSHPRDTPAVPSLSSGDKRERFSDPQKPHEPQPLVSAVAMETASSTTASATAVSMENSHHSRNITTTASSRDTPSGPAAGPPVPKPRKSKQPDEKRPRIEEEAENTLVKTQPEPAASSGPVRASVLLETDMDSFEMSASVGAAAKPGKTKSKRSSRKKKADREASSGAQQEEEDRERFDYVAPLPGDVRMTSHRYPDPSTNQMSQINLDDIEVQYVDPTPRGSWQELEEAGFQCDYGEEGDSELPPPPEQLDTQDRGATSHSPTHSATAPSPAHSITTVSSTLSQPDVTLSHPDLISDTTVAKQAYGWHGTESAGIGAETTVVPGKGFEPTLGHVGHVVVDSPGGGGQNGGGVAYGSRFYAVKTRVVPPPRQFAYEGPPLVHPAPEPQKTLETNLDTVETSLDTLATGLDTDEIILETVQYEDRGGQSKEHTRTAHTGEYMLPSASAIDSTHLMNNDNTRHGGYVTSRVSPVPVRQVGAVSDPLAIAHAQDTSQDEVAMAISPVSKTPESDVAMVTSSVESDGILVDSVNSSGAGSALDSHPKQNSLNHPSATASASAVDANPAGELVFQMDDLGTQRSSESLQNMSTDEELTSVAGGREREEPGASSTSATRTGAESFYFQMPPSSALSTTDGSFRDRKPAATSERSPVGVSAATAQSGAPPEPAVAMDNKKAAAPVQRKKSVKELLSRFETSAPSPAASPASAIPESPPCDADIKKKVKPVVFEKPKLVRLHSFSKSADFEETGLSGGSPPPREEGEVRVREYGTLAGFTSTMSVSCPDPSLLLQLSPKLIEQSDAPPLLSTETRGVELTGEEGEDEEEEDSLKQPSVRNRIARFETQSPTEPLEVQVRGADASPQRAATERSPPILTNTASVTDRGPVGATSVSITAPTPSAAPARVPPPVSPKTFNASSVAATSTGNTIVVSKNSLTSVAETVSTSSTATHVVFPAVKASSRSPQLSKKANSVTAATTGEGGSGGPSRGNSARTSFKLRSASSTATTTLVEVDTAAATVIATTVDSHDSAAQRRKLFHNEPPSAMSTTVKKGAAMPGQISSMDTSSTFRSKPVEVAPKTATQDSRSQGTGTGPAVAVVQESQRRSKVGPDVPTKTGSNRSASEPLAAKPALANTPAEEVEGGEEEVLRPSQLFAGRRAKHSIDQPPPTEPAPPQQHPVISDVAKDGSDSMTASFSDRRKLFEGSMTDSGISLASTNSLKRSEVYLKPREPSVEAPKSEKGIAHKEIELSHNRAPLNACVSSASDAAKPMGGFSQKTIIIESKYDRPQPASKSVDTEGVSALVVDKAPNVSVKSLLRSRTEQKENVRPAPPATAATPLTIKSAHAQKHVTSDAEAVERSGSVKDLWRKFETAQNTKL